VLIKAVNTESNNFYAEALLLRLARSTAETASGTTHATPTYEQGLTTLRQILAQKQVDPSSYALADGSGLSRQNLVSPQSLVSVLVAMSQDPNAAVFRQSLAIAGESGTLSSRFNNTAVAGNLVGKTGTLKHTVTLAGYLTPPNYSPLGLSLMVNQSDQPLPQVRQAMDQIIQELMTLQPCQER
jgi:D-alanyl-D-alanine carboxypeptidase/D-alanyl-D-alanine-endopeptidase (penicillin-binding protein 4)